MFSEFVHNEDSSAFVVDQQGALVGLLIGMDSSASSFGVGFLTSISASQADAKSMTRGFLSFNVLLSSNSEARS